MKKIIVIAAGGAIGASARYLVSVWAANRIGSSFPYGTIIVNIVGCFIIGLFMTLVTERIFVATEWRLLISVGFLGGLTTFSSLSYETLMLLNNWGFLPAALNMVANLLLGLLASWVGIVLAKQF